MTHGNETGPSRGTAATALDSLRRGVAIPAHPLALTAGRALDERRQRALSRYYLAAGAGGLAVAVHTTQFAIRRPEVGLFRPVLELAAEEMDRAEGAGGGPQPGTVRRPLVRIAGVCGPTAQAVREAEVARSLGYHAGLLSLAALADADDDRLIDHCRAVAGVLPVIGFYLQPAAGGRPLGIEFWRRLARIDAVVAIKIAPFDRYKTLDVVRAVAESGRDDIALYTGNDDNIVLDLLTPFRLPAGPAPDAAPTPDAAPVLVRSHIVERRIVGGLLGHWSVWTRRAVELLERCRTLSASGSPVPPDLLALSAQVTDANAAFFDPSHGFAGCIAGLHEVLRRQGLLEGIGCLNPDEGLSPGQAAEIDRVYAAYPHLNDDEFVARHRDEWLNG